MRSVLLATALVALPLAAFAQPTCVLPGPLSMRAQPTITVPPPIAVSSSSVPLVPRAGPVPAPVLAISAPPPTSTPALAEGVRATPASARIAPRTMTPADIQAIPALAHIAAAGATLADLGTSHGLRTVYARHAGQVMVFEVAPDGQATVAGLMTDLSVGQLKAMGGKDVTDLQPQHGLRALFLRNGPQFQVFYASPDGERVIPGVMWDAAGKDLTRDLVASIPGTVPTVTIGAGAAAGVTAASAASPAISASSLLAIAQATTHGSIGTPSVPELWMFIDPQCAFSVRAMQELTPFIAAGKVRLNVIPLSILDGEDNGLSTRSALNLVSIPPDRLVAAWESGRVTGTPSPDANAKLQANMAAAAAIGLKGTPTFLWRRADGTAGRLDGVPTDVNALLASIGR